MNDLYDRISQIGIVPVVKILEAEDALPLAKALYNGGIDVAEVTFRSEHAVNAIQQIHSELPDMLLGAGTVLTIEQAKQAKQAGASFIVTPGLNPNIVKWCLENEIPVYNPLLIYGGSGLGKTHLIQATGNAIVEKYPYKKVFYSTSEEFSNTFFQMLQKGEIQEFRDTFRSLDVLLLDDIQFFEKVFGKGGGTIEEEFFHTFNKLQELGKQIIMISDRYPKDIKNLSKRMESRFLSGLSVEIQQPGFETRVAILKRYAVKRNIEIDDNILEYIADTVDTNVREMEGMLTSMSARSKLLNEKITLQQVQDELANRIRRQRAEITAEKIIETVSVEYDVPVTDMKSKKRQKKIVNARQIAMFLLKNRLDLNLTTIGGLFGGKDHSTVISSIRKVEGKMEDSKVFKGEIDRLKQNISK